jgi:hypothetical protein
MYYNTAYTSPIMGTPSIPVTFNRIDYKDGRASQGATLSLGLGYTLFFGSFTIEEDGSFKVDPQILFGVAATGDLKPADPQGGGTQSGFTVGFFAGIKFIQAFIGHDFVNNATVVGLGSRIDAFNLTQAALWPYGSVQELYPHDPDAKVVKKRS